MTRKRSQFFTWRHALLESSLPATTKHVLLTLSCHMNDAGEECYPSIARLCRETGLSKQTVITHLRHAESCGWIERRAHGFSGQRWARNEYRIRWPDGLGDEPEGGLADRPPLSSEAVNDVDHLSAEGGQGNRPPSDPKAVNLIIEGGQPNHRKVVKEVDPSTSVSTSESTSKEKTPTLGLPPNGDQPTGESMRQQAIEVLEFLNEKTGRNYRTLDGNGNPTASLRIIMDRLRTGVSVQDCKTVIARKHRQWCNAGQGKYGKDMFEYLRPDTLFQASKFESYLGQCVRPEQEKRKPT